MSRKKAYIKEEVVDKAMHLFWLHGYENTSMQMLEKKMGINKFSIYSSFGSKHGLFMESIKAYKSQMTTMFEKFENATNGVDAIKAFFYDSVTLGNRKGCLVTNTYNEFAESNDIIVKDQMDAFMAKLKHLFIEKLKMNKTKDDATVLKEANFLLLAKHGLAAASRVNDKNEIRDYIEMTFKNI